jgi:hypothetical protein
VGVELTNEDNLKRLRSPAIISKRPVTRLSRENWNALLDDLPFDLAPITMDFWDFGEPLLHPDAIDFIREASARGIRSDLYTNGLLLDEPKIDRLLESGLEALFYRLDAATPNTYGKVSGDAAPYARAVANLELLLKKKKRRGGSTIPWRPIVSVQITEMTLTNSSRNMTTATACRSGIAKRPGRLLVTRVSGPNSTRPPTPSSMSCCDMTIFFAAA